MSAWEAAVQSVGTVGCLALLVALGCRLHWSTRAGLTQQEIADTAGVNPATVSRDLANASSDTDEPVTITNARGQQRPATYSRTDDVIDAEVVDDEPLPGACVVTRYSVASDDNRNRGRKRDYLLLWSGPFASVYEGSAVSLPRGDGYMVDLIYRGKVRVSCPVPRDEVTYRQVDAAINAALNAAYPDGDE